jgi:hypothetical protein
MATTVGSLYVMLAANTARFTSDMRQAKGAVVTFSTTVRTMGAGLRAIFPALGGIAAVTALIGGLKKSVSLARAQVLEENKLTGILKATGFAAGYSVKQLREYAGELQNITNYGDEATLSAMGILATFRSIKGQTFKDATAIIQDMATALGTDLKSAALQVGKALQDPTTGMTALRRSGISFTAEQIEMVKAMQKVGNLAGAQGVIMEELRNEVEGTARAAADPLTQLGNTLGEVGKTIGLGLLPYLDEMAKALKGSAENADLLKRSMPGEGGFGDFVDSIADATTKLWRAGKLVTSVTPGQFAERGRSLLYAPIPSELHRFQAELDSHRRAEEQARAERMAAQKERDQAEAAAVEAWGKQQEALQKSTDKLTQSLGDQVAQLKGETATEAMIRKWTREAQAAHKTETEIAKLTKAWREQAEVIEDLTKQKETTAWLTQLKEQLRTPLEMYKDDIAKLIAAGADAQTYARAAAKFRKDYIEATKKPEKAKEMAVGPAAAVLQWSRESVNLSARQAMIAQSSKTGTVEQRQLKEQQETNEHLKDIQRQMERDADIARRARENEKTNKELMAAIAGAEP